MMRARMTWTALLVALAIALAGPAAIAEEAAPEAEEAAPEAEEAAPAPDPGPRDIRQVQIQAWISETSEVGLRNIGANLNFTRFVREEEMTGSVQEVRTNVFDPTGDFGRVTLPAPNQDLFDPPMRPDESGNLATGVQSRSGFGLNATILSTGTGSVDAVFRGIERQSDVDLISKPELLVIDNGMAEIRAGGQIPFQDVQFDQGTPQLNVRWRDVGVNMRLQPTILPNDFIQLNLQELEVSDITRIENLRGIDLPVFSERSQSGFVYVPNGQTLVIGGLSSRVVRNTERRVPLVGRVPIMGIPFRSRRSEANITHLLIFVSPTIVDLRSLSGDAFNALNFWRERGAEWQHSERIEREIEAMEHEL